MRVLESAENYLETILILKKRNGNVRSIDIATELSFSKASVSVAMKQLRENGYIRVENDGNIFLLEKGTEIANSIYDRHVVLTDVLIKLGVDSETAASDACKIEHVVSPKTIDAFRRFLEQN